MDFSKDILRPLEPEELCALKDIYGENVPINFHAYSFILNQLNWDEKLSKLSASELSKISVKCKTKFYTHRRGSLERNATFVAITGEEDYAITFFSLEESQKELKECLEQTNRIDWTKGPLFSSVRVEHYDLLKQLISDHKAEVVFWEPTAYFWLSKSEAKFDYEVPDDVVVDVLKVEDVPLILDLWPHKYEQAEAFINSLIVLNGGYGIYAKSNGELLSWIVKNEFSGLGLLHTIDKAQRKGYGSLLIKILANDIASNSDGDVITYIIDKNEISRQLFYKFRFVRVRDCSWVQILKQ